MKKRGTELRRDLEFDLIHSFNVAQPGASGQSSGATIGNPDARSFGGYQAWINQGESLETNLALGGNVIYKGNFEQPADANLANGTGVPRISTGGSTTGKAPLALSDI